MRKILPGILLCVLTCTTMALEAESLTSAERAVIFNPGLIAVSQDGDRWIIIDSANPRLVIMIHKQKAAAENALQLIQYYGFNERHLINDYFSYFLSSGKLPDRPYPGETCRSFDPRNVVVQEDEGQWILTDGQSFLMYLPSESTAVLVKQLFLERYGVTRQCRAGGVPFWRRDPGASSAVTPPVKAGNGQTPGKKPQSVKPATGKADLPFYIDCSQLEPGKQALCDTYIANTRDKVYPMLKAFGGASLVDCPVGNCCKAIYYTIKPNGQFPGGLSMGNRITYGEGASGLDSPDKYDVHELFHTYSYCTCALDEHVFHDPVQHIVFTRLGRSLAGCQYTAEDRATAVKWKDSYLEGLTSMSGADLDVGCRFILGFEMMVAYFDLGEDAIQRLYRLSMEKPNPVSPPKQRLVEIWGRENAGKVRMILETLQKEYRYSFNDLPSLCGY